MVCCLSRHHFPVFPHLVSTAFLYIFHARATGTARRQYGRRCVLGSKRVLGFQAGGRQVVQVGFCSRVAAIVSRCRSRFDGAFYRSTHDADGNVYVRSKNEKLSFSWHLSFSCACPRSTCDALQLLGQRNCHPPQQVQLSCIVTCFPAAHFQQTPQPFTRCSCAIVAIHDIDTSCCSAVLPHLLALYSNM